MLDWTKYIDWGGAGYGGYCAIPIDVFISVQYWKLNEILNIKKWERGSIIIRWSMYRMIRFYQWCERLCKDCKGKKWLRRGRPAPPGGQKVQSQSYFAQKRFFFRRIDATRDWLNGFQLFFLRKNALPKWHAWKQSRSNLDNFRSYRFFEPRNFKKSFCFSLFSQDSIEQGGWNF